MKPNNTCNKIVVASLDKNTKLAQLTQRKLLSHPAAGLGNPTRPPQTKTIAPVITSQNQSRQRKLDFGQNPTRDLTNTIVVCESEANLKIMTINSNSLTENKAITIGEYILEENIDICCIVDTRLTPYKSLYISKQLVEVLGPGARVICNDVTSSDDGINIGGNLIVLNQKWGGAMTCHWMDSTGLGLVTSVTLLTAQHQLTIIATYWPVEVNSGTHTHSLWQKTLAYINQTRQKTDPLSFVQRLIDQRRVWAAKSPSALVLCAGDLNGSWHSKQGSHGSIKTWGTTGHWTNPIADYQFLKRPALPPLNTFFKSDTGISGIDHILVSSSTPTFGADVFLTTSNHPLQLCGYMVSSDARFATLSDHRPLLGFFHLKGGRGTAGLTQSTPTARQLPAYKACDLNLDKKHIVQEYDKQTYRLLLRPECASPHNDAEASTVILALSQGSATIVRSLTRKSPFNRKGMRNKWSPAYVARRIYHDTLLKLRRHHLGQHGYVRWSLKHYCTNAAVELKKAVNEVQRLAGPGLFDPASIINEPCHYEEWLSLPHNCILTVLENLLTFHRAKMHYRERSDLYSKISQRCKIREQACRDGKLTQVIRSLTDSVRKPYPMLSLEIEDSPHKNSNGAPLRITLTNPEEIHKRITETFTQWFKADETICNDPLQQANFDWKRLLNEKDYFFRVHAHKCIPGRILEAIWAGIRYPFTHDENGKPVENLDEGLHVRLHNELMASLTSGPPSLEQLRAHIAHLPKNSAGGVSGLTYNMIKAWHPMVMERFYEAFVIIWNTKVIPWHWDWRFLAPISKVECTPLVTELRPLMLIEPLRKIFVAFIVQRIQEVWDKHHALSHQQHGARTAHGTDTALLLNTLEEAEETESPVYLSSFDCQRAFDSLSKPLKMLSWARLGIPIEYATLLTSLESNNVTVVRTPWAWHHLQKRHTSIKGQTNPQYADLYDRTQLPGGLAFTAMRGAGQGDIPSPMLWDGYEDITCRSLQLLSTTKPFYLRDNSHWLKQAHSIAFVDDLIDLAATAQDLQESADVSCGAAIIFGLKMQVQKLRCAGTNYGSEVENEEAKDIIMHTGNWQPSPVLIQRSGTVKYLGIQHRINSRENINAKTSLLLLRQTLRIITCKRASAYTKWKVASVSTLAKIVYIAAGSALTLAVYDDLERELNAFYKIITLNLKSFPSALLHSSARDCGLGLTSLNDKVQITKLNMVYRSLTGDESQHTAATGLIERALRQQCVVSTDRCIAIPNILRNPTDDIPWIYSIIPWLDKYGLCLARGGYNSNIWSAPLSLPSKHWPECVNATDEQLESLHYFGVHTFSDIINFENNPLTWIDLNELTFGTHTLKWLTPQLLQFNIPNVISSFSPELLIYQCWTVRSSIKPAHTVFEVLGRSLTGLWIIRLWGLSVGSQRTRCIKTGQFLDLLTPSCGAGTITAYPYHELFPPDTMTVHRVILSGDLKTKRGVQRRVMKLVPSPIPLSTVDHRPQAPYAFTAAIAAVQQLGLTQLLCYTDGSFVNQVSPLEKSFRITDPLATGALVFVSSEVDWYRRPIHRIQIDDIGNYTASGAYTPELLSIVTAKAIYSAIGQDGAIYTDSEASIKALQSNPRKFGKRECAFLLQASLNFYPSTTANLKKVAAHPEKRVSEKDRWIAEWTRHEWGNYLADKTAGSSDDFTDIAHYVTGPITTTIISARTILNWLTSKVEYFIADKETGHPILATMPKCINSRRFGKYLENRDVRYHNGDEKWRGRSYHFAATLWDQRNAGPSKRAHNSRIIFDKLLHGGNLTKRSIVSDTISSDCPLCGDEDYRFHVVRDCSHDLIRQSRVCLAQEWKRITLARDAVAENKITFNFLMALQELIDEDKSGFVGIGLLDHNHIIRLRELCPRNEELSATLLFKLAHDILRPYVAHIDRTSNLKNDARKKNGIFKTNPLHLLPMPPTFFRPSQSATPDPNNESQPPSAISPTGTTLKKAKSVTSATRLNSWLGELNPAFRDPALDVLGNPKLVKHSSLYRKNTAPAKSKHVITVHAKKHKRKSPTKGYLNPWMHSSKDSQIAEQSPQQKINSNPFLQSVETIFGLIAHCVPMDGNCLYHAIADQLYDKMNLKIDHVECRRTLVRHLPSLRTSNAAIATTYSIYNDVEFSTYLGQTGLLGTWGEHIELHCLSEIYNFRAVVYFLDPVKDEICVLDLNDEASNKPTIHLALSSNHYWSLRKIDTRMDQNKTTAQSSLVARSPICLAIPLHNHNGVLFSQYQNLESNTIEFIKQGIG